MKIAAISWKNYQYSYPAQSDLAYWFQEKEYLGLAIITGRISNLIVIDFDSQALEQEFIREFPGLMQTRIISSAGRNLSHYYYHITNNLAVKSRHVKGADLLSDGCYAIVPPTIIAGKTYKIKQGGLPLTLTPHDIKRIEAFFQKYEPVNKQTFDMVESPEPACTIVKPTVENIIRLYKHHAPLIGRNNALFKVACYARDHGWQSAEVKSVLVAIHATESAVSQPQETFDKRAHEANKTIQSVFKCPPKKTRNQFDSLPNSVREALLKMGLPYVARVLDALFMYGFQSGMLITGKMIKEALMGVVGRHSILEALKAVFADNTAIFEVVHPSPGTPSYTSVACNNQKDTNKKCFLFSATDSDKNARGRPARWYLIPDVNVLCARLGVVFTRSDDLKTDDICNAKTYRQAVHRELIKRRPGMYSRGWLAARLGVSRRTCQRYDNQIAIQRQAMYIETAVTWRNLGEIPAKYVIEGTLLRDSQGRRYPAKREVATALLTRGLTVTHLKQDVNYYWYHDNLPVLAVRYGANPRQAEIDAQREKMNHYLRDYWDATYQRQSAPKNSKITQSSQVEVSSSPAQNQVNLTTSLKSTAYQEKPKRYYRAPLADEEAEKLANRLYDVIWQNAIAEQCRLSQVNARRAVEQYGISKVNQVIGVLKKRQNIQNPAGFAMMWLRSSMQVG